jgi:hypothetical protein
MKFFAALLLTVAWMVVVGCEQGDRRAGRQAYNAGIAALAKSDLPEAQKQLLAARDQSVGDPDLMFRANYNLGIAYVQDGDRKRADKDPNPQKALELYDQAIGWIRAAIKERKSTGGDELVDAEANLVIVLAKRSSLNDEMRKDEKRLEKRLDVVIAQQRQILDGAQAAWAKVKQAGAQNPLASQAELTTLANDQRVAGSEAGVVVDMGADEIDAIGKKPEDKRSQDEQVRLVILRNLDLYMLDARARMAEARRKFQELASEPGLEKAEAGLVALKRAREQFLDPIAVLRAVGVDQVELLRVTTQLNQLDVDRNHVVRAPTAEGSGSAEARPRVEIPAWFAPNALAVREGGLGDRSNEVLARMSAALEGFAKTNAPQAAPAANGSAGSGSNADPTTAAPPAPMDPKQVKLMAGVARALPMVQSAQQSIAAAKTALADAKYAVAQTAQLKALEDIARAIEEFSDLRGLIEVAHGEQSAVVQLLSPEATNVPAKERGEKTREGLRKNAARVERLAGMITDELADALAKIAEAKAKASQQAGAGAGSGSGTGSGSADPAAAAAAQADAQLEQTKKLYAEAESLRVDIAALVTQTQTELDAGKDPTASAKSTLEKIEALRRLFFSVIEHLKELITTQGETRDQTVAAGGNDEAGRAATVPGIIPRQQGHSGMAKAIADALAKQADAAQAGAAAGQGGQGPGKKQLSEAADEVRLADGEMATVVDKLTTTLAKKGISHDFEPMTTGQTKALEHLQKALALLEPPKQQNQDQQNQDQQKQDQKDNKDKNDKKDPKDKDQEQADKDKKAKENGSAGQRARDDEAKRQRKRQEQQSQQAPVDKDW